MSNYFKSLLYLYVLIGFVGSFAGSYDDYFTAIKRNDAATVSALINRGFDVNTPNAAGESGLLLAVRESSLKVIDVLIKAPKIKIESRSAQDESPLMLAAIMGMTEVCRLLIAADADVNKPGWTALHYAASKGHLDIMNLLLENHAYIDADSPNGTTPLMMAAQYGTPAAVKLLLDAGADPHLKNSLGLTALDFATQAERPDAVKLLKGFIKAMPDRRIPDVIIR
jgi:ankyrin repeat protein